MATREDVLIRFGGDAKGVNATLASIRTSISGLSNLFAGLGVGVGIAGVTSAIKDTLSWADDLADTADRVGLTTDAIQSLRAEAELFGVTSEEVDSALTKFSINLGRARQGTGDLAAVFKQYNQSLSGTATEVLGRYIKLLQNARSEAEQNRLAVAGFGKAGANLAQSIAQSNIPLDQMVEKFRALGLVMDEEGVRKLGDLNDQFDRLKQQGGMALKGFVVDAVKELETLGSGFGRLGQLLSHWASGDFIGIDQILKWEAQANQSIANVQAAAGTKGKATGGNESGVGNASAEFTKYLTDRKTALMSATQLEAEIWKQYSAEATAIRKGDEEAAVAAQKAQEDAFKALAGKDVSKNLLANYQAIVGEIEKTPIKAPFQMEIVNADGTWHQLAAGISKGGAIPLQVDVTARLVNEANLIWTSGENAGTDLPKAVDQTGANP